MLVVRVNNETEIPLCNWSAGQFSTDEKLRLITDDLRTVKAVFTNVENIEILNGENLLAHYTIFDGYSGISYIGTIWSDEMRQFIDCMEVTLTKTNLAEEVKRIEEQINPVIDESTMTIEELKTRRIQQITEAGSEMIYAGTQVTLSSSQTKSYKYTVHDQLDLDTYFNLFLVLPEDTDYANTYVSWHATDEICQDYSVLDIMIIFFALKQHLFYYKTYTNVLKTCVANMDNIEDVRNAEFGMTLPPAYQASMDATMQSELATIMAIKEKFFPTPEPDDGNEDDEGMIPDDPDDEPIIPDGPDDDSDVEPEEDVNDEEAD